MRFDLWVRKIPWRRKWQSTSSILAWEIPWTEEPDGLQSMGSQRIGHDLAMQHIVPKTSPPSLHPWLWLCGHLVNQGASSVWNLNHSNPYYFFPIWLLRKDYGWHSAAASCFSLCKLRRSGSLCPGSGIHWGFVVGHIQTSCPQRRKALLLGPR